MPYFCPKPFAASSVFLVQWVFLFPSFNFRKSARIHGQKPQNYHALTFLILKLKITLKETLIFVSVAKIQVEKHVKHIITAQNNGFKRFAFTLRKYFGKITRNLTLIYKICSQQSRTKNWRLVLQATYYFLRQWTVYATNSTALQECGVLLVAVYWIYKYMKIKRSQ